MKKILLVILFWSILITLTGCVPAVPQGNLDVSSTPGASKTSGDYCLTEERLEEIKLRPVSFVCNGIGWILAEENVQVKKIIIHPEKRLIEKGVCDGIQHYTAKCHPPSFGSLYNNTLWKLRDPDPNRPIKDGDYFDIYIRSDAQPEGAWICGKVKTNKASGEGEGETNPLKGKIIKVNDKNVVWVRYGEAQTIDIENVPPREKISEATVEGKNYDVFINLLKAFSPDKENFYLVEEGILPESNNDLPEVTTYDVFAIIVESTSESGSLKDKTLKLGTFDFPPLHPWYEVYIPECKPVIYFYPERQTSLSLWLYPKGYLTKTEPDYKNSWKNLWLTTSGEIFYQGKFYPYLHYEAMIGDFDSPKTGFMVKKENLSEFFNEVLPKIGLNQKETKDFKEYWLSRLVNFPYFQVSLLTLDQIEAIEPVEFSKKPDTFFRVRFYFKGLDLPAEIAPPQISPPPPRKGFTVVEWGGLHEGKTQ